ncbi:MAG: NAD(P)/FAD-dependent oxidoreductase [Thermoplasmata archaeon]
MNRLRYDVIVVGAGAAGIAAAERLLRAGRSIRVLEGRDRIGGRAFTDYSRGPSCPLELGAQMVHGRSVATHAWIQETGLSVRPLPLMQKGRFAVGRRVARMPWMAFPFHPVFGTRATLEGGILIPRRLDAYAGTDLPLASWLTEARTGVAARSLVDLMFAHVYAADADAIGVRGPLEEERAASEKFGFTNFQLREGYSELMRRRADSLRPWIQTGAVVRRIDFREPTIRVRWERPTDGQSFELGATAVIVTVPLGVLRAGMIAFDPPLSEVKRRAIDRIAMGDAIAVHFWTADHPLRDRWGDFSMIWGDGASSFLRPRVGLGEAQEVYTAFTVGREARRRASWEDSPLLEATIAELESILPAGSRVGPALGTAVHRWPFDPFAVGAYSYLPPGVGLQDRRDLSVPEDGRVFFAGEATHSSGAASTVHGAIETGYRAAEEALRAFPNKSSSAQ